MDSMCLRITIFILLILLSGHTVRCDDSTYFKVQRPEDQSFRVYWNVPTFQCTSKNIHFKDLYEKYGILQNDGDKFQGDKLSIMYVDGLQFPSLGKDGVASRNGGLPQDGDMDIHIEEFNKTVLKKIPDEYFDGLGIIDMEVWRPVFRHNFGVLTKYVQKSIEIEKLKHTHWKRSWIEAEAKLRFEHSARSFMEKAMSIAKTLRPYTKWGFYGYPQCFNMDGKYLGHEDCSQEIQSDNDGIYWLWAESGALYPSVYSKRNLTLSQRAALIRGRVAEAKRVSYEETPVLPYVRYQYIDDGDYMTEQDLSAVVKTLYNSKASGFIIWGASDGVRTPEKCKALLNYVDKVLGPIVAKYTRPANTPTNSSIELENGDITPNVTTVDQVIKNPVNNDSHIKANSSIINPEYNDLKNNVLTKPIEKVTKNYTFVIKSDESVVKPDKKIINSVKNNTANDINNEVNNNTGNDVNSEENSITGTVALHPDKTTTNTPPQFHYVHKIIRKIYEQIKSEESIINIRLDNGTNITNTTTLMNRNASVSIEEFN